MNKEIFKKHIGKLVKITLKPDEFALYGRINAVLEDCIEFKTKQSTSYLNFENITTLIPRGN